MFGLHHVLQNSKFSMARPLEDLRLNVKGIFKKCKTISNQASTSMKASTSMCFTTNSNLNRKSLERIESSDRQSVRDCLHLQVLHLQRKFSLRNRSCWTGLIGFNWAKSIKLNLKKSSLTIHRIACSTNGQQWKIQRNTNLIQP